ncbi:hypothetical protein AZE42_11362 [Rhizopogon vesiculosus]|uniref:DUF6533 domain-containing protein n=1 Tax=Rhizopogon vesiculosus TaxID=180088 RepID=A0A1J8Q7N8_9AGAM|nr:hypothetical protein AZE42_11362 [Rhizopogon vesiculosus]
MSNEEVQAVTSLFWNNYTSSIILTLISYEYLLQFEKEVTYVWQRRWSLMSWLYLIVRYFGLFIALLSGFWGGLVYMPEAPYVKFVLQLKFSPIVETSYDVAVTIPPFIINCAPAHHIIGIGYDIAILVAWGLSVYSCFSQAVLIWRLYALYNQSKHLLYVLVSLFLPIVALSIGTNIYVYSLPNALTAIETVTPNATYCTVNYNVGYTLAIYGFIPIICYDALLVILAAAILVKHLKERRRIKMKPDTLMIRIVRYHIINFVLNMTNQILQAILWAYTPSAPVMSLSILFIDTAPFIIAPRLIISIWDTHAHSECVHVSTTFADCVCWTSPPTPEEYEIDARVAV